MHDMYGFGYPTTCQRCASVSGEEVTLRVKPYSRDGSGLRLMLIGQDPTIRRNPERVKYVLMLDQPRSALSRWLVGLFAKTAYDSMTIYATNAVKCTFATPPSSRHEGGLHFLRPYYLNCRAYLLEEITRFRPDLAITLGEPAHRLFVESLDNRDQIPNAMQQAFTGRFFDAKVGGVRFAYSPCLHISTFRVAETYGASVVRFKEGPSDESLPHGARFHDAQPCRRECDGSLPE